eukprot:14574190-Alexandrium_andersonii.AAC.1
MAAPACRVGLAEPRADLAELVGRAAKDAYAKHGSVSATPPTSGYERHPPPPSMVCTSAHAPPKKFRHP